MKRILSFALILWASAGVFAQEKTIQKEEFDAVQRNGYGRYAGKSYRRTESSQDYEGSVKGNVSSRSVMEFAPPGMSRSTREFNSPSIYSKNEMIMVGGVTYTKNNNDDWKAGKPEIKPRPESKLTPVDEQVEYKFLGNEKLDNQNTNVYQKLETKKLVDPSNNREMFSTVTTKYWFGEDGGILKQETIMESRFRPKNPPAPADPMIKERVYRNVRTTIWELDPNIKIEAPNLN